jgi:hypothetical protein
MRFRGSLIAFSRWFRHSAGTCAIAFSIAMFAFPSPIPAQSGETGSGNNAQPPVSRIPARRPDVVTDGRSSVSTRGSAESGTGSGSNASSRRSSSSSRRSTSASRRSSASAQSPAGSPPASGTAKSTVVRRQLGIRRDGSGGSSAPPLPGVKIQPGFAKDALYLNPAQAFIRQSDRFFTTLELYNVDQNSVDTVDVWIKYNPVYLQPDWVDFSMLADRATTPPAAIVWEEEGYLRIQAGLKKPLDQPVEALAKLHWRGIAATPATRIEIAAPPGEASRVLAGDHNLAAPSNLGYRGRVHAAVRIDPLDGNEAALNLAADARGRMVDVDLAESSRVRLAIVVPDGFVATDDVATADVVLLNPADVAFDTIRFRVRFDPHAVKILDADQNNYIVSGINIFDGDFHDSLPFDFHGVNRVDPTLGIIDYEMGTLGDPVQFPSGTVARIVYRMQRRAGATAFWFERSDPLRGLLKTEISARGVSLLGDNDDQAVAALHGVRLMVRPLDLASR